MAERANVYSTDALRTLAAALRRFRDEASAALDELSVEVNRAIQWIQYDQQQYWRQELRRAYDEVAEARTNLERAQLFRIGDERPSCELQTRALQKAKQRLARAEEKVEAVRHWSQVIEHQATEYRAGMGPLATWLEIDAARAVALLERMSEALDRYAPPPAQHKTPVTSELTPSPQSAEPRTQEDPDALLGLDLGCGQAGAGRRGAAQGPSGSDGPVE